MVLFVTLQLGGDAGVFKSALDVLTALLKYGTLVTVVSGRGDRTDTLPPVLNGFDTNQVEFKHLPAKSYRSGMSLLRPVRTFRKIVDLAVFSLTRLHLRHFRAPELVLVNGLCSHAVWSAMKKMTAAPKAIIVRESPRHFQSATSAHDLNWAIGVLSQYDHHIFVSSNCRDEWSALGPLRNIPNDYIPNCCEEERARKILETDKFEIRKSLGIPSDRFVIMCVGSLQPRKGQNLIIEKLASIILHIPQALVCLVGSDPLGWKQELVKRVKEDLEDHVRFIPSQPSALEWIYAADVLLLPSKAEAMPRVVLEAMVLKTPVVAAQVDGVSELIEHSSSGWLFSHDKLEDMVKGLQTATFPEKSSRVVQAASTAYWENFSRAKLVERYCLAFAKIKSMH